MNKKVSVLGAGISGVGAARLAKIKGFEVFVSDSGSIDEKSKSVLTHNEIEWEEGGHDEARILNSDEVIKSPGIPEKAPLIQKLRKVSIPIISEIEFAYRYTDAKIIAISGSNGKTTTTMLCNHMFQKAKLDVGMAGNVGVSMAGMIADRQRLFHP